MNSWVQRGLRTALLTGSFLAVGAGVATADENDLTADLLGVTATVPVADGAVVQTPVLTGHGGNTTVGSGTGGGIELPVNTDTAPETIVLGSDGTGGVIAPVRVTEATDSPPDPQDGLTVTVPVNTSGGGTAGTTITVPVVTGDVGDVLDGDPATGTEIDVDLDGPLVWGTDGWGLLLDVEDTVTIGDTDGRTAADTVLEVPVSLEGDRPSTVTLPLGGGDATAEPLSGNEVDAHLGGVIGDGRHPAANEPTRDAEPALSLPIGTGNLLSDVAGGNALTGNTVDVHLGDLLGGNGSRTGTVVTVPVNEGRSGTGGNNLLRVTLPIDLFGNGAGTDEEPGSGGVTGSGHGPGTSSRNGSRDGSGVTTGDGRGNGGGAVSDCGDRDVVRSGSSEGAATADGAAMTAGTDTGAADPGVGAGTSDGGDSCGVGDPGTVATQSSSVEASAISAMAGVLALTAGLFLAAGAGRVRGHRS